MTVRNNITLAEIGEDGLLSRLQEMLRRSGEGLIVGTGDDAAVTSPESHPGRIVWTTDTMVENTHFRFWKGLSEPRWLGNMLVRSNVSDIAAMGARPLFGLLSVGAPGSTLASDMEAFFEGLEEALSLSGAKLIGGDLVRAPQWTLTLTLAGTLCEGTKPLLRSAAKPGNGIYVTGFPGRNGTGLRLLEAGVTKSPLVRDYLSAVCETVAFAAEFAEKCPGSAAMDLSDGVARDACRMAAASGVRLILEKASFPFATDMQTVCGDRGWKAESLFLHGGEDFELLFACSETETDVVLLGKRHGLTVTRIGRVEEGNGVRIEDEKGRQTAVAAEGFEHFT